MAGSGDEQCSGNGGKRIWIGDNMAKISVAKMAGKGDL